MILNHNRLFTKRHSFAHGFTVLEVILSIVIASGLLATAMYFYQQASQFRNDLLKENERISSARLILDRLSSELRCTIYHPERRIGMRGGSDWIEFLKSSIPSIASWQILNDSDPPPYPETGYRLVRYELTKKPVLQGIIANDANQQMIDQMTPRLSNDLEASDEALAPLMQGDAINRTEQRLLTAKISTNSVVQVRIDPVRITDQLKHMKFRYFNGNVWVDTWPGPKIPSGIEINLGIEPMAITNLLEEYTNHVFRRIVPMPSSHESVEIEEDFAQPELSSEGRTTTQDSD